MTPRAGRAYGIGMAIVLSSMAPARADEGGRALSLAWDKEILTIRDFAEFLKESGYEARIEKLREKK